MHVIVTDCHTRVSLSLIRELAAAGHEVTAVAESGKTPLGLHCRQTSHALLLPPSLSEIEYSEHLLDLCCRKRDSVLLPAGARTIGVLSRRREAFRTAARFLVPSPDVLEKAGDKIQIAKLAGQLGIPTPQDFSFEMSQPAENLAGQLSYPLVLKYRNGEALGLPAERRYTIVKNPHEFIVQYNAMYDMQPPVIVQEYIPGSGLGVSVLMDDEHKPVRIFCHERLREFPTSGGPSTACRSDWFPKLAAHAVTLLSALQFTGFAMVEFKGTPDSARLLEINPRIWGSYPLAPISGAGMAEAYVHTVHGVKYPTPAAANYTKNARMQYFVNDSLAGLSYLRHGHPGKALQTMADTLSPKVKGGVFSWRDLPGSFYYFRSLFAVQKRSKPSK